jgi:hypothetical protein
MSNIIQSVEYNTICQIQDNLIYLLHHVEFVLLNKFVLLNICSWLHSIVSNPYIIFDKYNTTCQI